MYRISLLLIAAALIPACVSTSQNVPVAQSFPAIVDRPVTASVFIDQNGNFYPDDWTTLVSREAVLERGSLLNATFRDPVRRAQLAEAEERLLTTLKAIVADKSRVVIITHGYNNTPKEAGEAFDLVEQRIAWHPDDALIRVYWDGLVGSNGGELPTWFAATGASQLVGSRGLRRVLDLLENKDVTLVSHSRGASVLLSALSNPTYSFNFRQRISSLDFAVSPMFLRPAPLRENGNRIHLILLAPAVGYPDFWGADCESARTSEKRCGDSGPVGVSAALGRCPQLRDFSPQLKSISYTLNRGDTVLQKKVGNLRRYFNATDLGYNAAIGERIASCYSAVDYRPYLIADKHGHPYTLYAQDPELAPMLRTVGVEVRR